MATRRDFVRSANVAWDTYARRCVPVFGSFGSECVGAIAWKMRGWRTRRVWVGCSKVVEPEVGSAVGDVDVAERDLELGRWGLGAMVTSVFVVRRRALAFD